MNETMTLQDRIEFALRDAGFNLDEAARIAALAHPRPTVEQAGEVVKRYRFDPYGMREDADGAYALYAPVTRPCAVGVPELPPIVREVLEWYASDPSLWVAWNAAGWAEEEAAKASGHYVYVGEDARGHNEYRPNGVRAEEALEALKEWQEATLAAAPAPGKGDAGC